MRVTICQWDSRPALFASQQQALFAHCQAVSSELLLLPELPFDDWLAASSEVDSQRWALSVMRHLQALQQFSALTGAALLATRPVVDGSGLRFNRGCLWSGELGALDIRDKLHLPEEQGYWEASWCQPGAGQFDSVEVGACRLGLLICSELWFLEHARNYGQQGVHLLCVPRATPTLGNDAWLAAGRTAAIVAGAYCLSSNQCRPAAESGDMAGMGWLIDPEGEVLAVTSAQTPFVTLDIDLGYAEAAKLSYPRYLQ